MNWTLHPDEEKVLNDIISCCKTIGISSESVERIKDTYCELKKRVKSNEPSPFDSYCASRYYQEINLTSLNKLWISSYCARRMDEIIKKKKMWEPYQSGNFSAQLLNLFLSSFCASAYTTLCLMYEQKLCFSKKNRAEYGKHHPTINEKARKFFEKYENEIDKKYLVELLELRHSITHFFIAAPFIPEKEKKTKENLDNWVIPNPSEMKCNLPKIVKDRENCYISEKNNFIELRNWYIKTMEWLVDLVEKLWVSFNKEYFTKTTK